MHETKGNNEDKKEIIEIVKVLSLLIGFSFIASSGLYFLVVGRFV